MKACEMQWNICQPFLPCNDWEGVCEKSLLWKSWVLISIGCILMFYTINDCYTTEGKFPELELYASPKHIVWTLPDMPCTYLYSK